MELVLDQVATKSKYYDWSRGRMLDPQEDGCNYEKWANNYKTFPFALHPKGFLIFLTPTELEVSDEYKEEDPYTVQQNLKDDFQQRRINCTIELVKSVISAEEANATILDLGCGQGHITSQIKKCFPLAEISGLDYSMSAINYAVEAFPGIDFVVGNACNPPYSEGYFDIIICNNLFEHVLDPLRLLKSISRIIKVMGYLIISTPSRYRMENLIRIIRGKSVTFMSKSHITEYSMGQVIELLKFTGFELIKTYSRPISNESTTIKGRLVFGVLKPIIRTFLKMIDSHHSLESTLFFLARRCR